jgi:hypothetical protein
MPCQGTRETKSFLFSRPATRQPNNDETTDLGLSKRVRPANTSFSGFTISSPGGEFGVFKVFDQIVVTGTTGGLNNGDRTILAVTPTAMTVDWPCKTEGPIAGVEIRTP